MIYIIIPTYNRVEVCNNFINQLKNQTYQDFKVILIDHGSIKTGIPSSDKITVLQSNVNGWAKAINIGLRFIMDKEKTNDDYVLIINDDVTIENDYLLNVHQSILEKPEAILGTCCINEKNNKTLRVAIKINKLKAKNIYIYQNIYYDEIPQEFIISDLLTGKGTVIPLSVLNLIGIYDEVHLPHYKADHEIIWRAKKKGVPIYSSKKMRLFTKADQKRPQKSASFFDNLKFMLIDMRSTYNIKDLFFYSFDCFNVFYAIYYFTVNVFRYILGNSYLHFKSRNKEIESQ